MNGSRTIDALASTWIHATWQVLAVLIIFVCWRAVVRPSAQSRYVAGALTLLSMPVLATFTFLRALERGDPSQTVMTWVANLNDPELGTGAAAASLPPALEAAKNGVAAAWPVWGDRALVIAWAFGVAVLLLRQIGGLLWLRREVDRRGTTLTVAMQNRLDAIAVKLGVRRVAFTSLATVDVPVRSKQQPGAWLTPAEQAACATPKRASAPPYRTGSRRVQCGREGHERAHRV